MSRAGLNTNNTCTVDDHTFLGLTAKVMVYTWYMVGLCIWYMDRVGQNRIYTYIYTVYLMIFNPKIPYVRRIYIWFWPTLHTDI